MTKLMMLSILLVCVYAQKDTPVALILDYKYASARENPIYNIETDPLRENLIRNKSEKDYSVWYYKIKTGCPGVEKDSLIAVECGWPSSCKGWDGRHFSYNKCLGRWDFVGMNYNEKCNSLEYQCFIFV